MGRLFIFPSASGIRKIYIIDLKSG